MSTENKKQKTKTQHESYKLNFIGNKMRTIAQETGSQKALRNCLGVGDGQGGLACCGSWGRKKSDTTERLK